MLRRRICRDQAAANAKGHGARQGDVVPAQLAVTRSAVGIAPVCLLVLAVGCTGERERPPSADPCPTWQDDLAPAIDAACASCHGAEEPAAGYDLSSYEGAIAPDARGRPRAAVGDETSPILRAADPERAEPPHDDVADPGLFSELEAWVMRCELSYVDSRIHEPGIMNPRDDDFHGALLRDLGWDFGECAACHGADFEGGVSEASCTSCHAEGPTDCETCHGDLEDSAPHAAHLGGGAIARPLDCQACHPTPDDYRDPGHIFGEDGEVLDEPAAVEFGALARHTPPGYDRDGPPHYDRDTQTCTNVYCHGGAFDDPAASQTAPTWTDAPDQAACGTCHGDPPADHASEACGHCHPTMPRDGTRVLDVNLHVTGEVAIHGDGDCADCHGTGEFGAPPPDLAGRTSTDFVTVGAHRAHLQTGISAPLRCEACHVVPDELHSPGHIDTPPPAEVFPPGHESLAHAGGAEPSWDRDTATCSDVYCHGGGDLGGDGAPGVNREPRWTAVGEGEAACGGCHGVPPVDDDHEPDFGLTDCHTCHGDTVDQFGNIIVTGPPGARESAHIDGELDAD